MSQLGRCPDCPSTTHSRILIDGKCPYHFQKTGSGDPLPELEKAIKEIPKESKKQSKANAKYNKEASIFKKDRPRCEINWEGCTILTTELHHEAGRGKWLLEKCFFRAACRSCHDKVGADPKRAIAEGMSLPRHNKKEFYEAIINERNGKSRHRQDG